MNQQQPKLKSAEDFATDVFNAVDLDEFRIESKDDRTLNLIKQIQLNALEFAAEIAKQDSYAARNNILSEIAKLKGEKE